MKQLAIIMLLAATTAWAQTPAPAAGNGTVKNDESSVNSACSAEAAAAGCGSETAGHGLVRCIHAYKKAQKKAFTISEGCKAAMHQFGSDVRAKRAAKAAGGGAGAGTTPSH